MSQHHFDTDIAERVGVHAAIIFDNIRFWCARAKANGANFHDGYHWVYNSVSAWTELFPYMTEKQIRGALDRLYEEGLVEKGCFNKDPRDRTLWYTVAEMHLPSGANGHSPSRANATAHEGEPLPDTNLPDNNPDTEHSCAEREVFEFYNRMAREVGWTRHQKLSDAIRKPLRARIREYGSENVCRFLSALAKQEWTYSGFPGNPDFRLSLTYACQPSAFAKHFDKLVPVEVPPSHLLSSAGEEKTTEASLLDSAFAFYAKHGRWKGRLDGFLYEPDEPEADYPDELYAKYGLTKPGRAA